jgi:hypothetical protein
MTGREHIMLFIKAVVLPGCEMVNASVISLMQPLF